jgi:tetratricopeptide (TPR) repeat protein
MANTWQGLSTPWLPPKFSASISSGLFYEFDRDGTTINYSVNGPDAVKVKLPVGMLVGGRRHGLGFLVPIQQIDGMPLARPTLIQARYTWTPEKKKLLIAPGCNASTPKSLESALGLVLSPTFEARCLSCHGKPKSIGGGAAGGVRCESCHGAGSEHIRAVGRGAPAEGILNPRRLSTQGSIAVCAQCHVGLTRFSDPSPSDLLIANQVRAIQSSECYLQSRHGFSCTSCHDLHGDASADDGKAVKACLGCHSHETKSHAAICPVNSRGDCIGCHMPAVEMGALRLVDHVIRVHPEQGLRPVKHDDDLRTQIKPISEYLRLIATRTSADAAVALDRVSRGESFYEVARNMSIDQSAAIGGYIGRKTLSDLDDDLRGEAARLGYGETSRAISGGSRWVIVQRLPRDFRWDAEQLQNQAETLAAESKPAEAIEKAQQALKIYPHFLRALSFIGATFAQSGNPRKGADVLAIAERLYPDDAKTEFALASALLLLNDQTAAASAFRRAIALEQDFTAAYVGLGMISCSLNDWQTAIRTCRDGLQIDPMSAELNHCLSVALRSTGDISGADRAEALARKLQQSQ